MYLCPSKKIVVGLGVIIVLAALLLWVKLQRLLSGLYNACLSGTGERR